MTTAENMVGALLEADLPDQPVPPQPNDRVAKWDKAHATFKDLYALKLKSMDLFRQMGRTIGYERALAQVGLTRADVSHPLHGNQIGATHNYKGTHAVKQCRNRYCDSKSYGGEGRTFYDRDRYRHQVFPPGTTECPQCKEPLTDAETSISPTLLRTKYANAIVGVVTNDGRYVWFKKPVPANILDD